MGDPKKLIEREDNWETDMGAWFAGERVVLRGKDLFTDLFDKSWVAIWFYTVTGRFFEPERLELMTRLWVLCSSFPEPRIWNNRVSALTGSARATAFQALASATSASEGVFFGGQANLTAINLIKRVKSKVVDDNEDLEAVIDNEISDTRSFPAGFGRPIINSDERIPPAIRLAKELGFDKGEHLSLALQIEKLLLSKRYRVKLNIGGLTAALCADQGLSELEYYCLTSVIYSAGIMACYFDASHKPVGTLFPLRCERIEYQGKNSRKWENSKNRLD